MPFDKEALSRASEVNNEIDNFTLNNSGLIQEKKNIKINQSFENLTKAEILMIEAQNRTTHAIRAIVRFLFIQLTSITLGALVFALSLAAQQSYSCQMWDECGFSSFLSFVSIVIVIGGIIISSNAGWSELSSSKIPKDQEEI